MKNLAIVLLVLSGAAAHAQIRVDFAVDPARDTPKVVGEFTHAFSDDLLGLTGSPEQVAQAAKAFAIYYEKGKPNAEGGYLVNHSTQTYLMGRKGEPIALVPIDEGPQAVAESLEKWVS